MILTNRLFERIPPSREAKSIYIFCEGAKREFDYFVYFKELDSRINIEVHKLHPHQDNSPLGLLKIAQKCMIKSDSNPNPKYSFAKGDEVWLVLDIDEDRDKSRLPQIEFIKDKCDEMKNWFTVRSNPCFEVWLYYHSHPEKPEFKKMEKCQVWKQFVNDSIKGGFDSRKHPIYIQKACKNAENNFKIEDNIPNTGSTEVYHLANSIVPLLKEKLGKVLEQIDK
jgi:hypothetical protein